MLFRSSLINRQKATNEFSRLPHFFSLSLLGDSYLRAGWIEAAQGAFMDAERIASRAGDFETRLAARLGLAKVAVWRMQPAADYLCGALRDASYGEDLEQADTIVQLIRKLS